LAAALAAVLMGAAPRTAPLTIYSAPAGDQPAGANRLHPTDSTLPDGRTAAPLGSAVFVGTNPQGVAVSPDGRFAIVSNSSQQTGLAAPASAPNLASGYSLAVVDTRTMTVASVYRGSEAFFVGVKALRDPARPDQTIVLASDGASDSIRVLDLGTSGTLTPETSIALNSRFPSSIEISANGRIAYVANNLGGTVASIDIATRRALHVVPVGYFPFGVAVAGNRVYATNGGLSQYRTLAQPVTAPPFANPQANELKSSSLSIVPTDANGDITTDPNALGVVRLDPIPDGVDTIGGAAPGAVVARRDGQYAYVAMANVDRVATLALAGEPRVIAGLDLRLFVNAPYGTQPSAEALSADGKRLYVALAGLNAVAVLDARTPAQLHRLGLIPTGWYPSALALSPDGRYLYITSAKGVDGWGMLQRVDLKKMPLVKATLSALRYNRTARAANADSVVPALRSGKRSTTIDRVVYISVGTGTFDAALGDLGKGDANPAFSVYPDSVTPNVHALARTFAVADNFYAADTNLDASRLAALAGSAPLYAQRTLSVNDARRPYDAHGQDPEDYPRSGYLFNALARAQLSFRSYGGLTWLSGYQAVPLTRPMRGLGGLYTLDVPGLAALDGRVDLDYPGWNPAIGGDQRAQAFIADFQRYAQAGAEPAFTYVWLPTVPGAQGAADADRALGKIVEAISHGPHWASTAVFIVPDGVDSPRDHVNGFRSYAIVVSPFAKRGYVGHAHLSVPSVLKTEEELLGLQPLSLSDLLATDMADFFGDTPYPMPYVASP
jgi:DNA-binding beta-propeller fold protein YncE